MFGIVCVTQVPDKSRASELENTHVTRMLKAAAALSQSSLVGVEQVCFAAIVFRGCEPLSYAFETSKHSRVHARGLVQQAACGLHTAHAFLHFQKRVTLLFSPNYASEPHSR